MICIKSKRENFRRCGVAHPKKETVYPDGRFSKKELAILEAEPMLTVERKDGVLTPTEAKAKATANAKAKADAKKKAEADAKKKAEADAKKKAEADAKAKAGK